MARFVSGIATVTIPALQRADAASLIRVRIGGPPGGFSEKTVAGKVRQTTAR
jgi:hypothetical protein